MSRIEAITCMVLLLSGQVSAVACGPDADIAVQVLGSGGPEMNDRRASSAYLIWSGDTAQILIDAGSGSALNFEKSGAALTDLRAVLFTHFHVDHSVDFPSLIKAGYFTDRSDPLAVFGPSGNDLMPSASAFLKQLLGTEGAYRYLSGYLSRGEEDYMINVTDVPLDSGEIQRYQLSSDITLSAVAVHHGPIPAVAWRVEVAGCSISFSGDMSNRYGRLVELARGSDLLVAHNAVPEGAGGAARSLHMPPSEIGRIAGAAKVKKLVISHRMQRTLGREKSAEQAIRPRYSGPLTFADDMDRFQISSGQH